MADEDSPGAPEPRVPRRVRSRGYAPAAAAAEAGGPAAAVASMTSNPMRLRRADQEEEEIFFSLLRDYGKDSEAGPKWSDEEQDDVKGRATRIIKSMQRRKKKDEGDGDTDL